MNSTLLNSIVYKNHVDKNEIGDCESNFFPSDFVI